MAVAAVVAVATLSALVIASDAVSVVIIGQLYVIVGGHCCVIDVHLNSPFFRRVIAALLSNAIAVPKNISTQSLAFFEVQKQNRDIKC